MQIISIKLSFLIIASWFVLSSLNAYSSESSPRAKVTLELFTSQGCSSCPPADRVLATLADRSDIVALTRPVQYWDRLGWKDTFATSENTERQYAYAQTLHHSGVYTPQLVINGVSDIIGSRKNAIEDYIQQRGNSEVSVIIQSTTLADSSVAISARGPASGNAEVHLLWLKRSASVAIGRGENARENLKYVNIVLADKVISQWRGGEKSLQISASDLHLFSSDRWAVLLQESNQGRIFGANFIGDKNEPPSAGL